jgi:hypothetical protein
MHQRCIKLYASKYAILTFKQQSAKLVDRIDYRTDIFPPIDNTIHPAILVSWADRRMICQSIAASGAVSYTFYSPIVALSVFFNIFFLDFPGLANYIFFVDK